MLNSRTLPGEGMVGKYFVKVVNKKQIHVKLSEGKRRFI
ncbi:hypothetical protein SAMN02746065_11067 [Desulfocicer vacuolatum DSM 3385]|uniref:Uncharacterized protein n=1 Tax=Desulfocicer vacuolatum DSM 3385 TaxID=1121400 RepID=A0A1W2C1A5_9BACT|nr:hypothetical protein SAMN02746065_11067 [Desulfocicer vacuolatum DSM 3385]